MRPYDCKGDVSDRNARAWRVGMHGHGGSAHASMNYNVKRKSCNTTTHPFALISTDFITDLPEIDGFDSIMVVVDHGLTKGAIFIPCNKRIDAFTSADLYLEHVYKRCGLPDKIISDRDPRFMSQLFQEIGRLLRVKLAMSTAYHPQTDGETK